MDRFKGSAECAVQVKSGCGQMQTGGVSAPRRGYKRRLTCNSIDAKLYD